MNKPFFLSFLFILINYILSAQIFETFYSTHEYANHVGWGAAIDEDNYYYIKYADKNYIENDEFWDGILKLNPEGLIVDSLKLPHLLNYDESMIGSRPYYLNGFLYCFGPKTNKITQHSIYYGLKIDLDLNVVDSILIPFDDQYKVYGPMAVELYDNKFVMVSNFVDSSLDDYFFISNGIFMMEVAVDFSDFHYTFNYDDDNNGFVHDFAKMPNGNYLLTCLPTWQYNFTETSISTLLSLATFSDSLTPISTHETQASLFQNEADIDIFQDSLFLLSGNKYIEQISDPGVGVYIMDAEQNLLDSVEIYAFPGADTLERTCPQCLDQLDENTIYFGSIKNSSLSDPFDATEPSWIRLVKLDANLDIIWERFYGGDRANFIHGVTATPDGGCLILCDYYDYEMYPGVFKTDLRIIKVDGNGEVTSVQENPDFQVKSLLMFPNPSDGEVNIDTALRDYEIWFYNHQGQLVYQSPKLSHSQSLDLHHLAQGIYTYVVVDNQGNRLDGGQWVKR